MIVLGIDSALGGFSAALTRDSQTLAALEIPGQVALEQGLPAVATVLRQAGIRAGGVDRIAVGVGPGSFTGVRIAISYAKSLAQGWKVPLAGVNSFDAIEADMRLEEPVLSVVRGRKGVVSVRFRGRGGERRASGYVRDVVDELFGPSIPQGRSIPHDDIYVVGHAEDVLAALGERGIHVHTLTRVIEPAALAIATIAAQREPARSLHEVRADYGELPAAKVPVEKALRSDLRAPRKAGPP